MKAIALLFTCVLFVYYLLALGYDLITEYLFKRRKPSAISVWAFFPSKDLRPFLVAAKREDLPRVAFYASTKIANMSTGRWIKHPYSNVVGLRITRSDETKIYQNLPWRSVPGVYRIFSVPYTYQTNGQFTPSAEDNAARIGRYIK